MGVPDDLDDLRDAEEDRRSVLATVGQLRESLVLSARDREAAQSVAAGLRDAKAANTRRVYASAWHEFNVWALANGRQSLPAEPQTVALYLGRLAADGKAMATIALARAAISHTHAAEGIAKGDNPARHPEKEELVPPWPATPGELALCILLFILFFALIWGLVLWDEVFINTSDTAADTVHAVLTGAGRMAVSSAFLAVTALCTGKAIVIMAKFFARRRSRP